MSRFGEAASRLAGMSAWLLGWRPGDFWNATPAELAAVLRAREPEEVAPPDPESIAALMERFPDR